MDFRDEYIADPLLESLNNTEVIADCKSGLMQDSIISKRPQSAEVDNSYVSSDERDIEVDTKIDSYTGRLRITSFQP